MKRCPTCNRVETDEALKFCRVDGATLVNDSGSVSGDTSGAKYVSAGASSEIETSVLPHRTDADINRPTAPTTVFPATATPSTTRELTKSKTIRRGLAFAASVLMLIVIAVARKLLKTWCPLVDSNY